MRVADHNPRTGVSRPAPERRLGLRTASLLVVASMVGSGVFTTTGLLLRELGDARAVLGMWLVGAVLAACGALAYAELTAALAGNGGEYALLSRIYHPGVGFVSGCISLVVGFSAPIAASAVAFGSYLSRVFPAVDPTLAALALIVSLGCLHAARVELGALVQDAATLLNVALILSFIVAGALHAQPSHLWSEGPRLHELAFSSKAALALLYVSFSYAGWNAPSYIAGEVRSPERTLPRAFLLGTGLVAVLYLGLNAVFLASAPARALRGVVEIGHVSAVHLFGASGASYFSSMIALGLLATVGALTVTGPRIYEQMGLDYPRLSALVRAKSHAGPHLATALQTAIASALAATTSFDALLGYVGFTLALSAGLTLFGVFVLRRREPQLPRPYRAWGHPFTTAIALLLMLWMVLFSLWEQPWTGLAGIATIATSIGLHFVARGRTRA